MAKHTLHAQHFLLASSDNDQVCECGAAGNARLFDGDLFTGVRDDVLSPRETASSLAVLIATLGRS